jgi:hypothetical protein
MRFRVLAWPNLDLVVISFEGDSSCLLLEWMEERETV